MRGRMASDALTDAQLRLWLRHLHTPGRLADPSIRDLLRAHGRTHDGPPLAIAREASTLLLEKIGALQPVQGAPREAWRSYMVLTVSFVQGQKVSAVAERLGMSERQVTRERTRAIRLLRSELETPGA